MSRTVFQFSHRNFSVGSAYELSDEMSHYIPREYQELVLNCLSKINAKYFRNPKVKFTISNEKIAPDKQLIKLYSSCHKEQPCTTYPIDKLGSQLYVWAFNEKNINYIFVVLYLNKDALGIIF